MGVIGRKHQVICITHLAQIAAMADAHYAIEKKVENHVTKTSISRLDEEASVRELARILRFQISGKDFIGYIDLLLKEKETGKMPKK